MNYYETFFGIKIQQNHGDEFSHEVPRSMDINQRLSVLRVYGGYGRCC